MHFVIFVKLKYYVITAHGSDTWEAIVERAGVGSRLHARNESFSREEAFAIVEAASEVTGTSTSELLRELDQFSATGGVKRGDSSAECESTTISDNGLSRAVFPLVDGDRSTAGFNERCAEEMIRRYDEWTAEKPDDSDAILPKIPGEHRRTRRNVLLTLGGVSAAGMGSVAGCLDSDAIAEADEGEELTEEGGIIDEIERETRLGMVIDTDRCIACLSCSKACKEENDTSKGVHWTYVFRWSDDSNAEYGDDHDGSMTRPCQHCAEPSCTYVCPTQGRYKREDDGIVLTDHDVCIGCRYCQVACPYGVNYFQWGEPTGADFDTEDEDGGVMDTVPGEEHSAEDGIIDELPGGFRGERKSRKGRTVAGNPPEGVMGKCTFCVHRQDSGDPGLEGTTACEDACPVNAIHFGDMNNPHDDPRQHLEERPDLPRNRLIEESGNKPSIIYIGPQPSRNASPVRGPTSYEERGMVEHRREVIDDRFQQEADIDE